MPEIKKLDRPRLLKEDEQKLLRDLNFDLPTDAKLREIWSMMPYKQLSKNYSLRSIFIYSIIVLLILPLTALASTPILNLVFAVKIFLFIFSILLLIGSLHYANSKKSAEEALKPDDVKSAFFQRSLIWRIYNKINWACSFLAIPGLLIASGNIITGLLCLISIFATYYVAKDSIRITREAVEKIKEEQNQELLSHLNQNMEDMFGQDEKYNFKGNKIKIAKIDGNLEI